MLGILLAAVILGVIITVMEDGDFPSIWALVGCVIIAAAPSILMNLYLPDFALVGVLLGAVLACFAIAGLCNMTLQRAAIAAGIYFGLQIALGFMLAMFT